MRDSRVQIDARIVVSINRSKSQVFLRREFNSLGSYKTVGEALRSIVKRGLLVRVGHGIYAKAKPSVLSGNPIPQASLIEIGLEVMSKLGVNADLGKSAREYRDGKSTQMPMATVLSVGRARVSRRIGFGKRFIRYERAHITKERQVLSDDFSLANSSQEELSKALGPTIEEVMAQEFDAATIVKTKRNAAKKAKQMKKLSKRGALIPDSTKDSGQDWD